MSLSKPSKSGSILRFSSIRTPNVEVKAKVTEAKQLFQPRIRKKISQQTVSRESTAS